MAIPLIGLTASHDTKANSLNLRCNYINAVRDAGGIPIILPLELADEEAEQLSHLLDGVIFTGGPDIHPFLFGEETHPGCGDISSLRDHLELSFFTRMYQQRKPILGICRGMQLINIALGGNIYQDIPLEFHEEPSIAHQQPFQYSAPAHTIIIEGETKLAQIAGCSTIKVNSMHHQAVKVPAPGLTICGRASDGLIEAFEMPGYPYLQGVQWHPEYLYKDYAHAKNLFLSFVNACHS